MLPIPHGIGCPCSWTTARALQGRPGFCAGIKRPQVAKICIAGVYATVEQHFLVNAIPYHGGIHTRSRCSTTGVPVGHCLRCAQLCPTADAWTICPEIIQDCSLVIDAAEDQQQVIASIPHHAMPGTFASLRRRRGSSLGVI